jgi:hypothetical protein
VERKRILTALFPFFLQVFPIFLYAETHYRFRYFFSSLRKHEPEILADAPHRIEPNQTLPILILVKDAHQFPLMVDGIRVIIKKNGKNLTNSSILESPIKIAEKLWWRLFKVPLEGISGAIECDVLIFINDGKRQLIYYNDNHRTSSHQPLKIFVASTPLPRFEHLHFGECHSHSSYTDDQVEFGAPLEASVRLSRSLGLSFFCATDHSYDLDDSEDNYLLNDVNLPKWHSFQHTVDDLNSKFQDFSIIRGEEVSCRNAKEQNIHLLLLGNREFIHGSGDGAEHWFQTRSECSISNVLNDNNLEALSFAAHPKEHVSLLQRLFLHRGKWLKEDFSHTKLTGIQFANGRLSNGFQEGYLAWVEALLEGKRMFAIAGNDAHGNFNRFRQIRIPFFKIHESKHQLFGKMRTGVFVSTLNEENILNTIQHGKMIITDGPVANLFVGPSSLELSSIGEIIGGNKHSVSLEVRSSSEYGSIDSVKVFIGRIGGKEELLISEKCSLLYTFSKNFSVENEEKSFIRAEIWTSSYDSKDAEPHFCLTNPIWFDPYFG